MPCQIYPIAVSPYFCDDYKVTVNGIPTPLDTARVSAVPFNRRWPGHQRQIEQTEIIQFLSFAMDEPVTLEIFPREPFKQLQLRPASAQISYEITPEGSVRIYLSHPQYFTVEPYERRHALHIFADAMPQYDLSPEDENVLWFGPGEHDVGKIELHSGQTLYLEEGAVVYACVHAIDADDIRILGRGILDNSRNKETILFEANAEGNTSAVDNAIRLHTVELEYCNRVEIDGITIRDSLVYNIRPVGCRGLAIRDVKIIGCWRFNSDGIDMHNCEDVCIDHCFLRTFDDSICIKGFDCYYEGDVEKKVQEAMHHNGQVYDIFRNAQIRRCVIWNDWGRCLEIGAETRAEEICDILFEDCDVIHVTSTVLDCQNVDYADVHDITYRNIRIELDETIPQPKIQNADAEIWSNDDPEYAPEILGSLVIFHPEYSAGGTRRGKNRRLLFEDIAVLGRQIPRFLFVGYNETSRSEQITVRNLTQNGVRITHPDQYQLQTNEFCTDVVIE